MSLTTTTPKITYDTGGATVEFDFDFKLVTNLSSEIKVTLVDSSDAETLLVEDTDYTVSAPNNDYSSGGTVTTVATYEAGNELVIESALDVKQELVIPYSGGFPPKSVEQQFDYITRLIQILILSGGISSTAASDFFETLLDDESAAEARDTLLIYPPILCYEGEILVFENEVLTYS